MGGLQMAVNGKQKGSKFEREQAVEFSLWLSSGNDKDLLWRSQLSGGRASTGKVTSAQYGDLAINKHDGKYIAQAQRFLGCFCIELKSYKKCDFLKESLSNKSNFYKWWKQVAVEAEKNKVMPLLVVKTNNFKPMIFITPLLYKIIKSFEAGNLSKVTQFLFNTEHLKLYGFFQHEFFEAVKSKKLLDSTY